LIISQKLITRPRMASGTPICTKVCDAVPAETWPMPATAIIITASAKLPVSANAVMATALVTTAKMAMAVRPWWLLRCASHSPATMAPSPPAEVKVARPAAPRPNTSSANPGSSSMVARVNSAERANRTIIVRMASCVRA
jgi:hypothetical protein